MNRRELQKPLRNGRAPKARRGFTIAPFVVALAFLVGIVAVIWIAVVDDPESGQPVATATIEDAPAVTGSLGARPSAAPAETSEMPLVGAMAANAPPDANQGLLEESSFGYLPRVAPDGRRPRDAYARRNPAGGPAAPRIVLIVGGLGISQTGTQKAIELLPETVTLAFAPYGSSLQRWADKARRGGHEILLQIPLEPDSYPDQNPGEHTLLVSTDRQANTQDLHWNLGRMTGYAGVMNYMGARFTGDDQSMAAFLGEIGERGLYYIDDGSSPLSRAGAVGPALQVPVAAADIVLDRDRAPAAVERELAALETMARARGSAVGVATAFPSTVDIIATWAREAESRGLVIAPPSSAVADGPQTVAR